MKAAVTTAGHGFDVIELPDPTPEPDQLVIRVAACGICGSDIKAQPFAPPGMVMGHEPGGEVIAAGSHTDTWLDGVNVAVLPVISCGFCQYCGAGQVSHCAQVSYIGMGPPGGFAELAAIPAHHAFVVPADIPVIHSALVEPFAVGLHGVHTAEIASGDEVLVVGAGGVGLTTLAWALEQGAARVTVADPDSERRELACAMGATDVLASASDADPAGYDAAIECVGRPELIQECQLGLRPRGRLVISGACSEPTPIEAVTALLKELTIRYSVCYRPDEFRQVINAFVDGTVDPTPMVGPTLGLARLGEAFDLVRTGAVRGRVLITPGAET
jgi:(R,R)-butanediol dehydrogenase/meso-butanediol dehydrogenase/diacetyl reductase